MQTIGATDQHDDAAPQFGPGAKALRQLCRTPVVTAFVQNYQPIVAIKLGEYFIRFKRKNLIYRSRFAVLCGHFDQRNRVSFWQTTRELKICIVQPRRLALTDGNQAHLQLLVVESAGSGCHSRSSA